METRIAGSWTITDEHAACSYGQPVLVDLPGTIYGPGDVVLMYSSWGYMPAWRAVERLAAARGDNLAADAHKLCRRFVELGRATAAV